MDPATWQRVKTICADALERGVGDGDGDGEREAFVAERCGGDAEVRREVLRLLAAHERAGPEFLEQPTGGPLTLAVPFDVGRRIGAWELVEELGAGGMGVVYLAERREADFEQRAALKVMRLAAPDGVLLERFHRERQILAGLEHPNIAHLLDGGTTDDGVSYFAMEYVEGRPIDRYCEEEALSIDQRLVLFREVCSAVAHAHRSLVVHRDLKPSNILVTSDGTPKLLDFGIAKLLAVGPGEATVTRFQALTLDYASPEQLAGGAITTASDVYSLGALLYRLLTGGTPFPAGTKSLAALTRERGQSPPRPSAGVDGATARRLRGDLDSIVLKALRPEPEHRYGSVEALADDVARHGDGRPVGARRGTFTYLAGKFIRRHKAAVGATVLVALALVGATVASNRAATRAEAERAKAERISGFLRRMISSPDASWFSSGEEGREVRVIDVLEQAARDLDAEENLEPSEEAMIRRTFGATYRGLGLYEEAVALLREAVRLDRLGETGSYELAVSLHELGGAHYMKGDFDEAIDLYRQAIEIFRSLPGDPDEEFIKTLQDLGLVYTERGDLARGEPYYREALALNRARVGDVHPINAIILANLGVSRAWQGDLDEAAPLLEDSLGVFQQLPGTSFESAVLRRHLANVAIFRGEHDRAEWLLRDAMEVAVDKLGDEHPHVASIREGRAHLSYRRGDLAAAERELTSAIGIQERALGTDHIHVATTLTTLGRVLTAGGSSQDAEAHLRRALELRRGQLPPGDWRIADSAAALGECLAALGRRADAEPLLEEGAAGLEAALGPEHLLTREASEQLRLFQTGPIDPSVLDSR